MNTNNSDDYAQSANQIEALKHTEYLLRKNKVIDYILKKIINKTD